MSITPNVITIFKYLLYGKHSPGNWKRKIIKKYVFFRKRRNSLRRNVLQNKSYWLAGLLHYRLGPIINYYISLHSFELQRGILRSDIFFRSNPQYCWELFSINSIRTLQRYDKKTHMEVSI